MNHEKFIITTDKDVADKLLAEGFQMLPAAGNTYTFINSGNVNFSENEIKKIVFTNILYF